MSLTSYQTAPPCNKVTLSPTILDLSPKTLNLKELPQRDGY